MTLLALSAHTGIRTAEVGFLLMAIAGAAIAFDAAAPTTKRTWSLVGGIALAAGAVLVIVATHWGHF
jgi:hypothetical protein